MRQATRGAVTAAALAVLLQSAGSAMVPQADGAGSDGAEPPPPAIQQAPPEIIETPGGEAEIEPPAIGQEPAEDARDGVDSERLTEGQFNTQNLLRLTVVSADGKDVGRVTGFIVDGREGRIVEMLVEADRLLGLSLTEFGVDWSNVTLERGSDQVTLTVTQEQLTEGLKNKEDGDTRQ